MAERTWKVWETLNQDEASADEMVLAWFGEDEVDDVAQEWATRFAYRRELYSGDFALRLRSPSGALYEVGVTIETEPVYYTGTVEEIAEAAP